MKLYSETFDTEINGLPGGWFIERNSDMPQVPAIRCGKKAIELLSAGNKFLPVIPDIADGRVDFTFGINYAIAERFSFFVCFRYDTYTGRGQCVRFSNQDNSSTVCVEVGTMRLNCFTPVQKTSFDTDNAQFLKPIPVGIVFNEKLLTVDVFGKHLAFDVELGKGKIALSRGAFTDIFSLLSCDIDGALPEASIKETSFTVPWFNADTYYPIFCDVTLRDWGNCIDATLTLRGGIADTPVGEGNYHGIRADMLTRPYLKVITQDAIEKHVFYEDTLVMIPQGLAPKYLYGLIYKKQPWPFTRQVRFMKPMGDYNLAIGCDEWVHNDSPNLELRPVETVFTLQGNVLYSGLGLTGDENVKLEFFSQENKAILARLPKDDPRYERAVAFAKANHYFFLGEQPAFRIRLTGVRPMPNMMEVILEDAYLRPIRSLNFTTQYCTASCGITTFTILDLTVETLSDLPCGIYHLRFNSLDESVPAVSNYCAFEVMDPAAGSPTPQEAVGYPFLFNARTETRGLMTDAFDPWLGASIDEGHYVSRAVMLPESFQKYKMGPTIKAYGRTNFSWIGGRTLDNPKLENYFDVIKESAYVNFSDCNERMNIMWLWSYYGTRFQQVIDFLKTVNDPEFDIPALQELQSQGRTLPRETYVKIAQKYWEEWLDYFNAVMKTWVEDRLALIRKANPEAILAQYGPIHIYASAYKGPEGLRLLGNRKIQSDLIGFWQYEDYPYSCGYGIERGLYNMTSNLMVLPNSRIYPEIYTGTNKLKQGCPDGAVFYAHPPFGNSGKPYPTEFFTRQILCLSYGSGYLMKDGFHFWDKRGFQVCRFTRPWYERLLKIWPFTLENTPERPLRSPAYISSEASRRTNRNLLISGEDIVDVRSTAAEEVPFIYEASFQAGVCSGFQMYDTELNRLTADQTDTLVLPPLRGMAPETLARIRELHAQGVNLLACENVDGLEDLFGVKDTGIRKTITQVTPVGDFCAGMSEYCDDERCTGSHMATDAEILLNAEIPVLTIKKNAAASAAFFNVPPHLVKAARLHNRCYGEASISALIAKAVATLMKSFSKTGVSVTKGSIIGVRTKDGHTLVIVSNHDNDHSIITEITFEKRPMFAATPVTNLPVTLVREDGNTKTYRAQLPAGASVTLIF